MGLPFCLIVNFIKKCSLRRIFKTWQRSRSPFIYESFLEGFWQFGSGLNAWTRARFCLHLHLGLVSLWPHYVLWALKFPMLMWNVLLHQSGSSVWKNELWGGRADLFDCEVWSAEYSCVTSMSALHLEKPSMLVEGTDRTGPKDVSVSGAYLASSSKASCRCSETTVMFARAGQS